MKPALCTAATDYVTAGLALADTIDQWADALDKGEFVSPDRLRTMARIFRADAEPVVVAIPTLCTELTAIDEALNLTTATRVAGDRVAVIREREACWVSERAVEEIETLRARVAELEATLANERGDGKPPGEGWKWHDDGLVREWWRPTDIAGIYVHRKGTGWRWYSSALMRGAIDGDGALYPTARETMRAAEAILTNQSKP
jgi:predicted transcriptional regulator